MKSWKTFRTLGLIFTGALIVVFVWQLMPEISAQKNDPQQPTDQTVKAAPFPNGDDNIELNAGQIAVRSAAVQAERSLVGDFDGKRMHLVRFRGPIQNEWYRLLTDSGLEVVTYIPHYTYLVYGDAAAIGKIQTAARYFRSPIEWDGPYKDVHRIHPDAYLSAKVDGREGLRSPAYEVQLYRDDETNNQTFALLKSIQTQPIKGQQEVLHYINFVVGLDEDGLAELSKRPDVVSIFPYIEPEKFDEAQNFILRGNLNGNVPTTGGDWLDYLASKGFSQAQFDASNFIVNLSDSGVDTATPATPFQFLLRKGGSPTGDSRFAFSRLVGTPNSGSTLAGCDGHGNINATIIGGYVPTGGIFAAAPHADTRGFRYGMGVAPFVKVGSSVIFDPNTFTSPNLPNLESMAYNDGARISSNSWGSNAGGAYNTTAQTFDALVRDAQPAGSTNAQDGNQQMVVVFAAGNSGPGVNTMGAPGTSKNVITAGASENVQPFGGADQCGTTDAQADSAYDIVPFSSRGPNDDGRFKPDIMLPGTHVMGGVAQNVAPPDPISGNGTVLTCFNANGVCAGPGGSNFFPLGQQWYTASSGTSHSTPAIAGYAALIRQHFINLSATPPSPAMTKALMMNSAEYMNGVGANDTLPSNNQGMGLADMDRYFDIFAQARILRDQVGADKFTASAQQRVFTGLVADNGKPFRVTLAWTDPPGPTSGNAFINNLDLEVTVGGVAYKGNVFTGANSSAGGTADIRNNVESVHVPAGVSGPFVIKVKATNIAGNGVPNDADPLDQDFALLVSNASESPQAVVERTGLTIISESGTPANNTPDPGESLTVRLGMQNVGTANTGNTTVTLLNSGGITNPSGQQIYGVLTAGGAAVERDFSFAIPTGAACGSQVTLTFQVNDGVNTFNLTQNYTLGTEAISLSQNFDGVTAPALPAGWTTSQTFNGVLWTTSTTSAISAPNSAFVPDPATHGDSKLESPVFVAGSSATKVNFDLFHDTETNWDGVVLEVKIGAGDWQDILAAGGTFTQNGYNGTLGNFSGCVTAGTTNPIATRQAWTGLAAGVKAVRAVLPASAQGQNVQIRFRMGHDCSVSDVGARVDNIQIIGNFECALAVANAERADFDGDGRTDLSVFRPSENNWYIQRSTAGFQLQTWGITGDRIVPADYDADGKADIAVWRPSNGTWYGILSQGNIIAQAQWGLTGDVPVPADYNGDEEDDVAVWRPSDGRWYMFEQGISHPWGLPGDLPVPGDYDGDGDADFAVFRPSDGVWYFTINGITSATPHGQNGDMPVPADYDGDSTMDIAVWRPAAGTWRILLSGSGNFQVVQPWGLNGDIPVPGDYDGDGVHDMAVFRPTEGRWYLLQSTAGLNSFQWGLNGDKPVPVGYIPN